MGRSKVMGKPVSGLTQDELEREHQRCEVLLRLSGTNIAAKRIRKRLYEIEKRLIDKQGPWLDNGASQD